MKEFEESWIYYGLTDNLLIRYILRDKRKNPLELIVQLEYSNGKPIIRWDKTSHSKYHADFYNIRGERASRKDCGLVSEKLNGQIEAVFRILTSDLSGILSCLGHTSLAEELVEHKKIFLEKVEEAKAKIISSNKLNLDVRHHNQLISAKANVIHVADSMRLELRDSNGNIKKRRMT